MLPERSPESQPVRTGQATGLRIAVVVSRYHREVTDALLVGARDAFVRAGGALDDLVVADAPGAFELPVIAQVLADDLDIDGVVALGCVVTGETRHDEYINGAVANALQGVATSTSKPVGFGVLTVAALDQALARAGGPHGNKGAETMGATIAAVRTIQRLCAGDELPEELTP